MWGSAGLRLYQRDRLRLRSQDWVRRLRIVNSQGVAIIPQCEECGDVWLPGDRERWRAEFVDNGPADRLGFCCPACWEHEFGL